MKKPVKASASRLCPVCRQELKPTRGELIPEHFDANVYTEDICPAGGYPYRITVTGRPTDVWARQVAHAAKVLAS